MLDEPRGHSGHRDQSARVTVSVPLALVCYRTRQWSQALAAFRQADQRPARAATSLERPFVLAMTCWRLGNQKAAHSHFDAGCRLTGTNASREEMRRLRALIQAQPSP